MTLPGFHECPECEGEGIDRPEGCICPRFSDTDFRIADLTCRVHGVNGYMAQPDDDWQSCPECGGAGQVPDDDTVEVAARAIHQRFVDENSQRYGIDIPAWEVDADPWKEHMRSNARAALLAYARRVLNAASA